MADVIDFAKAKEERSPHMTGAARCLACRHEWEAVAPLGTIWLDCPAPSCGLHRGRFVMPVDSRGAHWTCACGNDLFHWDSARGLYCPNCGSRQHGHQQ